jgi:type II secretory pathway predicted ATPase ExeA
LAEAQKAVGVCKEIGAINLAMQQIQKMTLVAHLKRRNLTVDEQQELTGQKMELDNAISELVNQRKDLEKQVRDRHKA